MGFPDVVGAPRQGSPTRSVCRASNPSLCNTVRAAKILTGKWAALARAGGLVPVPQGGRSPASRCSRVVKRPFQTKTMIFPFLQTVLYLKTRLNLRLSQKRRAMVRDFGPPPRLSDRPGRPARGQGPAHGGPGGLPRHRYRGGGPATGRDGAPKTRLDTSEFATKSKMARDWR